MKKFGLIVAAGLAGLLIIVGVGGGTAYLILRNLAPTHAAQAAGLQEIDLTKAATVNLKFTTNLADERRYINVSFDLVIRDVKDKQKVEQNLPLVRDAIVEALNTKRATEITGENGRELLKQEIQEKANGVLGGQFIQRVLITDFVVQF